MSNFFIGFVSYLGTGLIFGAVLLWQCYMNTGISVAAYRDLYFRSPKEIAAEKTTDYLPLAVSSVILWPLIIVVCMYCVLDERQVKRFKEWERDYKIARAVKNKKEYP